MSQLIRPAWVKHFNNLGAAAGGAESLLPLDGETLVAQACQLTGLSDFGDFPWREAYDKLLWSLNNEAKLNTLGRLLVRAELLRTLQVRLRLADVWKQHPEVLESPVTAPIVIAGAARTGTSILQETLSQDPQFHLPYTWKCLDPLPLNSPEEKTARIEKAKCEAELWVDIQPEIRSMHDFGAELPTECLIFMSTDYHADYWGMVADMPSWNSWRMEQGYFLNAYRWHKRILQTMQVGEPENRTWLLKSPAHLAFLDVVKEVYPDVRIIHTHRDPVKCIPSTASITSTLRWERSDSVNSRAVGQEIAFGFQFAMENVITQRENGSLPDSQIADIQLRELIDTPVESIKRIYKHFNLPFTDDMPAKISGYLDSKHQGKFGKHSYSMENFGLTEAGLRESFKRYTNYYGIAVE
jgi:hypothetical protein